MINSTTKNNINFIISLCANRQHTHKFSKPIKQGDCIYATDSFICAKIPTEEEIEGAIESDTNFSLIFADESEMLEKLVLKTDELLGIISKHDIYFNNKLTCDSCNGTGRDDCFSCGQEIDCESCFGDGKVKDQASIKKLIKFNKDKIVFGPKNFGPDYIYLIAVIAMVLKSENIYLYVKQTKLFAKFDNSDVEIVLMAKF